jgi:3-deoxy-manno-octulosonate cytidylyltransferase (CMP-KDO synthetase)
VDREGYALYFSRAPIPWDREHFGAESAASEVSLADRAYLRHLGLYAYRVKTLKRLARLEPCVLEHLEALEQLRALYYGYRVAVTVVQQEIEPGVDTPSDLEYMRRVFAREHCARGAV